MSLPNKGQHQDRQAGQRYGLAKENLWVWYSLGGRYLKGTELFLEEQEFQVPHNVPQPLSPAQKKQASKTPGFEIEQGILKTIEL